MSRAMPTSTGMLRSARSDRRRGRRCRPRTGGFRSARGSRGRGASTSKPPVEIDTTTKSAPASAARWSVVPVRAQRRCRGPGDVLDELDHPRDRRRVDVLDHDSASWSAGVFARSTSSFGTHWYDPPPTIVMRGPSSRRAKRGGDLDFDRRATRQRGHADRRTACGGRRRRRSRAAPGSRRRRPPAARRSRPRTRRTPSARAPVRSSSRLPSSAAQQRHRVQRRQPRALRAANRRQIAAEEPERVDGAVGVRVGAHRTCGRRRRAPRPRRAVPGVGTVRGAGSRARRGGLHATRPSHYSANKLGA